MEPSSHGHELVPGDELGLDVAPDCCGDEMTPGGHTFTCGTCGTALEEGGVCCLYWPDPPTAAQRTAHAALGIQ
ncbi:hypothetical protein [Streptomyces sp. NPDC127084]|uniref:hypothetical protein n=1 Tax=Streptomyces sp. NPDC127084 TaxID=3347133 RepID=UPI00364F6C7D